MRCLALAQAWRRTGGNASFVLDECPDSLARVLRSHEFPVIDLKAAAGSAEDAAALMDVANRNSAAWIVVDGEVFSSVYLSQIRMGNWRILLLDDFATRAEFPVHIVLNQNLNACARTYTRGAPVPTLLLGTQYLLLRDEFRSIRLRTAPEENVRTIFISFGGSDPDNLSLGILQGIGGKLPHGIRLILVTTSLNPHLPQIQQFLKLAPLDIDLRVDVPNPGELMAESDLAVIAAGGTLWELLYLGCPVLSYSRNAIQSQVISDLAGMGAVKNLGAVANFDAGKLVDFVIQLSSSSSGRQAMISAGSRLVDGHGSDRVVQKLLEFTA